MAAQMVWALIGLSVTSPDLMINSQPLGVKGNCLVMILHKDFSSFIPSSH